MYVELHAHSYYSLLDATPSPEALVQRAAELDMPAIAMTDHDGLYGAPRFVRAAQAVGIKPILGAEITLVNGGGHLTLLAEDDVGYANLCQLITLARRDQQKGMAALPWRLLADLNRGLIALAGCRRGEIARAAANGDMKKARRVTERYAALFGRRNFFLELQYHHQKGDACLNRALGELAADAGLQVAATGNVHYLTPDFAPLQDVLTCINHRVPLARANGLLRSNREYFLRTPQQMAQIFAAWPQALATTMEIADRCRASLPAGPQPIPRPPLPGSQDTQDFLMHLCQQSLPDKRSAGIPFADYQSTLARELQIINTQKLAAYFLIVWDLVRFARSRGILCQGRGSAANSLVAYLLHITPIDPLAAGLVFERFLSAERTSAPDIDLDVASHRREEVIQYLYRTYGHDHSAMACTVVTFRARQALRDVGMALDFPKDVLDRICDSVDERSANTLLASESLRSSFGSQLESHRWQQLLVLAAQLEGFPRHLGIHNGGMILSAQPLQHQIPVEPASMEDRSVVQWDKDALEMAGWIKLDVLGLRMLSAISEACAIVETQTGQRPDLSSLRFDDNNVFDMLCHGGAIGVFQIESRAQASLIPRFQPRSFADLTVQIALIRPGPIQGNMVHPYLRRRDGLEPVTYAHPLLEPALKETLGVILFQEQVLKVARDLAGFTAGEGELLRRAMGHKQAEREMERFHTRFIEGARTKGIQAPVAGRVFSQLQAFGGYSFSKAHAAAFAVITYWSAWLRCYHPAAFFAGLLRNQPMGFYPPHVLVSDAQRIGVSFLPVDVRHSQSDVTSEGGGIRLGLSAVQGFGPQQIDVLLAERQRRPFASLHDLVQRTGMDRPRLEMLIMAGALDHFGERRQLLWDMAEAYHLAQRPSQLPLKSPDEQIKLPPMSANRRMTTAFAATGVSLDAHLTSLHRNAFTRAGATPIEQLHLLPHGQRVRIGGLVVVRQRPPTARGMCFLAVEDAGGMVNVVISPEVYRQYRQAVRSSFVIIDGILEREKKTINVLAQHVRQV